MSDLPGYDAWKLASPPEPDDEPEEHDCPPESGCSVCWPSITVEWTHEEASAVGACIAYAIEEIADAGETGDRLKSALAKLQARSAGNEMSELDDMNEKSRALNAKIHAQLDHLRETIDGLPEPFTKEEMRVLAAVAEWTLLGDLPRAPADRAPLESALAKLKARSGT